MKLKIQKLDKNAKIPSYAHEGDAGLDLFASNKTEIKKGDFLAIPTGISMEIPKGYVGLIWDKSGLSINSGLKVLGGVIDSGYRGEIKVGMINLGNSNHVFESGDKISQILIQKIERVDIQEELELSKTKRGKGGFGSTGRS